MVGPSPPPGMDNIRETSKLKALQATDLCTYLRYALCTILYQRGVYLEHDFTAIEAFGSRVMIPDSPPLVAYIDSMMYQLHDWFINDMVKELHFIILTAEHVPVEKYVFEFGVEPIWRNETESDITIRQALHFICSSASWLPPLPTNLRFRLQAKEKTQTEMQLNDEWAPAQQVDIINPVVRHMPFVHIKTKSIKAQIFLPQPLDLQPQPLYEATQMESPWNI